jgi:hypothetical protein
MIYYFIIFLLKIKIFPNVKKLLKSFNLIKFFNLL